MTTERIYKHQKYPTTVPNVHSTDELLRMQSQGKFLTSEEKQRVQSYAENKRKQRMNA